MKTTLDIPDDLFRRVQLHAIERNESLEDSVADLLETGLRQKDQDIKSKQWFLPMEPLDGGCFSAEEIQRYKEDGRE